MNSSINLMVKKIKSEDCYHLRESILRPGQPKENWTYPNDNHDKALHMGIELSGELVAVVTILPEIHKECPNHPWRLRGMAVKEEMQGKGIGQQLLSAVLMDLNGDVWCTARKHVATFYSNNGFVKVGEEFSMNNMPHIRMMT